MCLLDQERLRCALSSTSGSHINGAADVASLVFAFQQAPRLLVQCAGFKARSLRARLDGHARQRWLTMRPVMENCQLHSVVVPITPLDFQ